MNHLVDRSSNQTHRPRTWALSLVAGMLMASSCSLPFGDSEGGDDISADVAVSGVAPDKQSRADVEGNRADPSDGVGTEADEAIPTDEATPIAGGEDEDSGAATPAPSVVVDTRFNGRSAQYLGISVELGDLITTDQTIDEFLNGQEATGDDQTLLVEVAVSNTSNGAVALPSGVLGIRLATGERLPVEEMREQDGDDVSTIRPAAQATERVVLAFRSADLTGARFEISEASTIPQFIPLDLDEPVPGPYSLDLPAQAAVSDLQALSPWPNCQYLWTGEVTGARVLLEGVDGSHVERANKGSRWLVFELRVTNDTTDDSEFYPCNTTGLHLYELNPRLRIDGVATSQTNSLLSADRVDAGTSVTVEVWFQVPVETEEIELTDVDGNSIALWFLNLPLVDGEE